VSGGAPDAVFFPRAAVWPLRCFHLRVTRASTLLRSFSAVKPMSERISQQKFDQLVTSLRARDHAGIGDCMPYDGGAQVSHTLDHLAREHERRQGMDWDDVCPAYGLAVLTHGAYRLPSDDEPLETLWNEVGSESRLLWPEVRDLVAEAWRWLDALRSQSEMT